MLRLKHSRNRKWMTRSEQRAHIVGLLVEVSSASSLRRVDQHERSPAEPHCLFWVVFQRQTTQYRKGLTMRLDILLFRNCFFVLVALSEVSFSGKLTIVRTWSRRAFRLIILLPRMTWTFNVSILYPQITQILKINPCNLWLE